MRANGSIREQEEEWFLLTSINGHAKLAYIALTSQSLKDGTLLIGCYFIVFHVTMLSAFPGRSCCLTVKRSQEGHVNNVYNLYEPT